MPTYVYICTHCGERTEHFEQRMAEHAPPIAVACKWCNAQAKRDWSGEGMPKPDVFKPYLAQHMGHEPVYVKSRAHEARLCKERKLERIS